MRQAVAALILGLGAGAAGAQLLPLGAPIMPQTRAAAPQAAPAQSGRMTPAAPLGSNSLPANIQPQSALVARAASSVPVQAQVLPGAVADPNLALAGPTPKKKVSATPPGALRALAPKAPERTEMPAADAPEPR